MADEVTVAAPEVAPEEPTVVEKPTVEEQSNTQEPTPEEPVKQEENKEEPAEPEKTPEDEKPEENKEEKKAFNPEEVDFEDKTEKKEGEEKEEKKEEDEDNPNKIEGYDLDSFKDILDLESEDSRSYLQNELKELKELGFTQKQTNKYIEKQIQLYQKQQENEKRESSLEYKTEKLNKELSVEEKRNYKPILSWVKEGIGEEVPSEWVNDIMGNPKLVKVFNSLYKQATNNNNVQDIEVPKPKTNATIESAIAEFKKKMGEKDEIPMSETKEIALGLQKTLSGEDLNQFNQIYKTILNYKGK